jgi:predicted O-methyltransferase YrrM
MAWSPEITPFMASKLVALDRDMAEFCYVMARAIGARRIVEAGASWGVSTLYLAAAVRDNGGGIVFGAEYEPEKVKQARANFEAAGLSAFVDLREGDIVEASRRFDGPIDFVLFDIWSHVVRPVLDILLPRVRAGAVLIIDGMGGNRTDGYAALFEVLEDPAHNFKTMSLPFRGGLGMSTKL